MMDLLKHPLVVTIVSAVVLGYATYVLQQIDSLQEKVATLQAQVSEMNDNIKWMRDRWG